MKKAVFTWKNTEVFNISTGFPQFCTAFSTEISYFCTHNIIPAVLYFVKEKSITLREENSLTIRYYNVTIALKV